ncbi:serine/threonine-protein kinase [Streptomyces sp. NPDC050560]|uniref:serine/threonine-protein kinase n=1 Tax=Streptomyces sp. NPDC050560 TaxID=3365630 RepID=UPI0037880838
MGEGAQLQRVIDGRFELGGRLGGGGMGLVWRARDLVLHREVALKEVRPPDPHLAEYDPEGARVLRARVLREARALARLDHPNVVTVHHIVDPSDGSFPWIVMELVPGRSLQARLDEGPMAPREAAAIGLGVLSALRAAHAAGIHHRDVKPANVLLHTDGRPVLTDFGIATLGESTRLTGTGSLIGSPDYIAPERVRGQEGDPASDLWSLGMMLYVAVEGHHPLRRPTTLATLAAVLDGEIPPPARAGALTDLLTALLVRDPAARPGADEVAAVLSAVAEGTAPHPATAPDLAAPGAAAADAAPGLPGPPAAGPPSDTPPTGRPEPHHGYGPIRPKYAMIYAAVSLLMTTGVGLGIWAATRDDDSGGSGASGGSSSEQPAEPGASATGATDDSPGTGTATPGPAGGPTGDLLEPANLKKAIQRMKPVMGGTKVTQFNVYGDFINAEAPVPGRGDVYDSFTYRGGRTENNHMGGEIHASDEPPVDIAKMDWDKLPSLIHTAETTLGIEHPDKTYALLDPAWGVRGTDEPDILVYVGDAYESAYLVSDFDGKVVEKHPRS